MVKELSIEAVKEKVDLLKMANASYFVTIPELARELRVSKTVVMKFVDSNSKLFNLSERWEPKNKTVTTLFNGRKYKDEIRIRGKHLGVCVDDAYLKPEHNYMTDEWIAAVRIEKAKYIHITESNNYGDIQGYFILVDKPEEKSRLRYHLWRNTPEKIRQISKHLYKGSFVYGGFGDSGSVAYENVISISSIDELKSEGWTFNDFEPLTK